MMSGMYRDESHTLGVSSLHDWEILGVNICRYTKIAELSLYFPGNDAKTVLRISGIRRFILSGMMLQNVILDVLLFDEVIDSDYFEHCCQLLDIESSIFEQENGLKLIYFEPSVGAELACCFSDYEFIEKPFLKGNP